jgi:hypothetical protein
MKISCAYGLLVGLVFLAASPATAHSDEHGKKAHEHLEKAIKAGKKVARKAW